MNCKLFIKLIESVCTNSDNKMKLNAAIFVCTKDLIFKFRSNPIPGSNSILKLDMFHYLFLFEILNSSFHQSVNANLKQTKTRQSHFGLDQYYKQYSRDMILFDVSLATSRFGKVRGLVFDVVGEKQVEWGVVSSAFYGDVFDGEEAMTNEDEEINPTLFATVEIDLIEMDELDAPKEQRDISNKVQRSARGNEKPAWNSTGFCDFRNVNRDLHSHADSAEHIKCILQLKTLQKNVNTIADALKESYRLYTICEVIGDIMPKVKSSVHSRLQRYVAEFSEIFTSDGKIVFCQKCGKSVNADHRSQVLQHLAGIKHRMAALHATSRQVLLGEAASSSQISFSKSSEYYAYLPINLRKIRSGHGNRTRDLSALHAERSFQLSYARTRSTLPAELSSVGYILYRQWSTTCILDI
ncbi:hypothetical protein ANN_20452 [Periplaneta americana]|uniref:Uncharacterized protein n=1 Tax=Periplaneta americana TaxID=6978 RepID=A0ABQ8SCM0_PERAM|nr:hypothetical protein ANN_20452 [Periplaneta americana]